MKLLTPGVTKSLPSDWQNIDTIEKANGWINKRSEESAFLTILYKPTGSIVGFMFLYADNPSSRPVDIRLGYLIAESWWGIGLGSELVGGLVQWCISTEAINSISGGVEKDNIGSIKVLEKNGFVTIDSNEIMVFLERRL